MSYEQNRAAYIRGELDNLGESDGYRIKITSDHGETKWLRISPETLAEVDAALMRDAAGRSEAGTDQTP